MKTFWSRIGVAVLAGLAATASPLLADGSVPVAAKGGGCSLRFDGHTEGLPSTCLFVGQYNASCGKPAAAVFAGDGSMVVIGLAFSQESPVVYIPGSVTAEGEAALLRWRRDADQPAASSPIGAASLEDGGRTLRVQLGESPVVVDGCPFTEYVGHFVDMVEPGAASASAAPAMPERTGL
ncbi:MAG: hypothetical protein ACRERC_13880 [Candidatus Binatia bacterium]